mgnify:CR=1 FL=1
MPKRGGMKKKKSAFFTNIEEKITWTKGIKFGIIYENSTLSFPGHAGHGGQTEKECEKNVKTGCWREITNAEAVLL